jgi:hypothetical protein
MRVDLSHRIVAGATDTLILLRRKPLYPLILRSEERLSKDGATVGLMVLPAMRSIVRRRAGACHRAALRADPLALLTMRVR